MTNYLATWFYASPPGENIYYPGVGENSSDWKFQKTYWHCILTFFDRLYRIKQCDLLDTNFLLFLNQVPPYDMISDQIDLHKFLDDRNIEVVNFVPSFVGIRSAKMFSSQFYIYDVLNAAYSQLEDGDTIVLLDSDVLPLRGLDSSFYSLLNNNGQAFYRLDWPLDYINNDLSLESFINILSMCFPEDQALIGKYRNSPFFVGGEFLSFTKAGLGRFLESIEMTAPHAMRQTGLSIQTEEHLNTIAMLAASNSSFVSSNVIRRVWTDPTKYSNVLSSDRQLCLVHLPAEKQQGFYYYYHNVILDSPLSDPMKLTPINDDMICSLFRF